MSTGEVVTLQIGHYSNFVGTHWWNLQESSFSYDPKLQTTKEVNHDVLFREGKNLTGQVTYTPRLVALDLKGSLNTLKQDGTLYDVCQEEDIKWPGDVNLHKAIAVPKNQFLTDLERKDEDHENPSETIEDSEYKDGVQEMAVDVVGSSEQIFGPRYYNLDNSVTVWSDFLRIHLHPRSIVNIEEYTHGNELQLFDIFGCGQQVMTNYMVRSEIEDKIHYFTEECDHLQGFHVLADTFDGFGGIGASVLNYLEDEYDSKSIFTLGMTSSMPDEGLLQRTNRLINSALSYEWFSSSSSLFVPLSMATSLWTKMGPPTVFPYLDYKTIPYHTSAVLAASLDTLSLPYRKETSPSHMRDITNTFHMLGRKVASLNSTFPFPLKADGSLVDTIMEHKGRVMWQSLTPHLKNEANPSMQSLVLRGVPTEMIKSRRQGGNSPRLFSSCQTADQVLEMYLSDRFSSSMNAGCTFQDPCHVTSPFPHIFDQKISKEGTLGYTDRNKFQGVESVPVLTSLQSTPEIAVMLQHLTKEASRLDLKKHHRFLEAGMEEDDYKEVLSNLQTLSHCYDEKGNPC